VILPVHPTFLEKNKNNERTPELKEKNRSKRRNREELKKLVLEALKQKGDLSMNELATELGYKSLNDTLRAVVKEMLEAGEVTYLYPDKPNSRNQKICFVRNIL
jgi:ATP-dependent DNA helicase RecG